MNMLNKLGLQKDSQPHIENNEIAEKITKISETLIDLQKLATGKDCIIFLQSNTIQGGEIYGLTDNELDTIKRILGVSDSDYVHNHDDDGKMKEFITYSTKIPTVKYVEIKDVDGTVTELIFKPPFEEDKNWGFRFHHQSYPE